MPLKVNASGSTPMLLHISAYSLSRGWASFAKCSFSCRRGHFMPNIQTEECAKPGGSGGAGDGEADREPAGFRDGRVGALFVAQAASSAADPSPKDALRTSAPFASFADRRRSGAGGSLPALNNAGGFALLAALSLPALSSWGFAVPHAFELPSDAYKTGGEELMPSLFALPTALLLPDRRCDGGGVQLAASPFASLAPSSLDLRRLLCISRR
mmetsp:Transcript_76144/g.134749  ORF Transcript_76144/g.134749 Transcript_76144/m.134749 type:complete len:213 (-) Transcript_76144:1803-2441(-)